MTPYRKKLAVILIISSGTLVFTSGLYYFFYDKIKKTVQEIEKAKIELSQRSSIVSQIRELEEEEKKAEQYRKLLKQFLPSESEAIHFEERLKNIAEAQNLNISFRFDTLNPGSEKNNKNYSFNIVLSGKKQNIQQWFKEVEALPYAVNLERIEFIKQSASNDFYNVKVLGRIYLR